MDKPRPVIPLQYAPSEAPTRAIGSILLWMWITWTICLGACIALFYEIQTVVVGGPVVSMLAAFLLIRAVKLRAHHTMLLASAYLAVCLLFVALVNGLHWGPQRAKRPFRVMSSTFVLGALFATVAVQNQLLRRATQFKS